MAKNPTILSQEQANRITPDLPPAGHARNEQLKQNSDDLAAAMENMSTQHEVGKIDPKTFKIDREIQHQLAQMPDVLEVPGALPEFDYCWVYAVGAHQQVWAKKALRVKGMLSTWHVVQGDMPEAREHKAEDTTRRLGDVILMRIRKEDHAVLLQHQKYRQQLQELGVSSNLRELGDKHRGKGFVVHTKGDEQFASGRGQTMMSTLQSRAAADLGMKMVDGMLRDGTVPGMPVPGQE